MLNTRKRQSVSLKEKDLAEILQWKVQIWIYKRKKDVAIGIYN